MDAEVVAEPDNGSSTNSGAVVGVKRATWAQGEWVVEWVGGDVGVEGEF